MMFSSCRIFNPTRLLRTGIDYQYDTLANIKNEEFYRIAKNDIIVFTITTNDGEVMINPVGGVGGIGMQNFQNMQNGSGGGYMVEFDGSIKLPILGRKIVEGMSIRELESYLENEFVTYFNKPFVKVDVVNKRVFMFQGSAASVVPLIYQNTTLFQLLAQIGGVGNSKAHRIKIIRNKPDRTYVYSIDLSRIENINQGNVVLQANDIVYITPRDNVSGEIMTAIAPYLSLFTSLIAIYAITTK